MSEQFGALALPVAEFLALGHGTEFVGYSRLQVHAGGMWVGLCMDGGGGTYMEAYVCRHTH
jgi:hypothetical protein